MGIVLLFLYFPIFVVIFYSFNTGKTGAVWKGFTLDWYAKLLEDRTITDAFFTSLKVAAAVAVLSSIVGTIAAFAVDALNKTLKAIFNAVIYIPLIVPEVVLGIAFLVFFSFIPANYGIITLILAHSVFCIPYVFVLVSIQLRSFDGALAEAARDLGANTTALLRTIVLPLISPAIFSGAMLSLAMSLDDVIISAFVSRPKSQTLPVVVYSSLKLGLTPKINALCTIFFLVSFAAVTLMYFALSKKRKRI